MCVNGSCYQVPVVEVIDATVIARRLQPALAALGTDPAMLIRSAYEEVFNEDRNQVA
jgi:hypothetical protein